MIQFFNKIISWSFYLVFFLVPIIFAGDTSELFEFNKMWLTFGLTIIIAGAWISKNIVEKKIAVKRTPFDIPILLFLLSQLLSTFMSWDQHTSLWGYYSRFNGGLFSIISYIFLYFALVSNLNRQQIMTLLKITIASGVFVALWGLPSHFGYDPTCLMFRGTFDVSCWTDAFHPTIRIFSTMGQPDWLAAYLTLLIPFSLYFSFETFQTKKYPAFAYYLLATILFYLDFLYTGAKGSFIALTISLVIFFTGIILFMWKTQAKQAAIRIVLISIAGFFLITFFTGTPLPQLNKYTFPEIRQAFNKPVAKQTAPTSQPQQVSYTGEFGGTDSGKIRLLVWDGAIQAWLHNPLFGTGVETFAYAYYRYRPAAHNLTSEWDYLYNKAHNEYLNYLATTGTIGLVTYLLIIGVFLFYLLAQLVRIYKELTPSQMNSKLVTNNYHLVHTTYFYLAILTSYLTIIISNFFGFSVVFINIFFFTLPGIFFIMSPLSEKTKESVLPRSSVNAFQWISISTVWIASIYLLTILLTYWNADKAYALGYNLDRANAPQQAYTTLHSAVAMRPGEPIFWDEVSINDATLAYALASQKEASTAATLASEAVQISDKLISEHPNNIVFWKSRVRVLYMLSQADSRYLPLTLQAIQKAQTLAPTDAKIAYNAGLLYAQNGDIDSAVKTLQQTVTLKPDYRDAYYALALLLHQQAVDKNGKIVDPQKEQDAVNALHFILQRLAPNDEAAKNALKTWGED